MTNSNFYLNQQEPKKSCLLALRDLILNYNSAITETVKYGMPCFTFNEKAICYLWKDKNSDEPYVLFVEGRQLHHPQLATGHPQAYEGFTDNPNHDIPKAMLYEILQAALLLVN